MLMPQMMLTMISRVALILNSIVLYMTGVCLKFNGVDLISTSLVAIFDITLPIIHIVSMLGLNLNWVNPSQDTKLWCTFDSTLTLTLNQTTFETVAMLSLSYLSICHNKQYRAAFWVKNIMLMFLLNFSFGLASMYFTDGYFWKKSGLLCILIAKKKNSNMAFFMISRILLLLRIFMALFIMFFCYFKVALACFSTMEQMELIELDDNQTNEKAQSESSVLSSKNLFDSLESRNSVKSRFNMMTMQLFLWL